MRAKNACLLRQKSFRQVLMTPGNLFMKVNLVRPPLEQPEKTTSLVPSPSSAPVFDCLQYTKTGAGKAWERDKNKKYNII